MAAARATMTACRVKRVERAMRRSGCGMPKDGDWVTITGASGFIGQAVTARFLRAGYKVRAVFRRTTPPERLQAVACPSCTLFRADLTSRRAAEAAVGDSTGVIHLAGAVTDWGPRSMFYANNVQSTINVLRSAKKAGAKRFVYGGSVAVHGFGRHVRSTESGPYYALVNPYQSTKLKAERFVLSSDSGDSGDFTTIVLRPGNVMGRGDTTSLFPMFDAMGRGGLPYVAHGYYKTCPIHVEDLADAFLAAYRVDRPEERVFDVADDESVRWRDFLEYAAATLGISPPRLSFPRDVARLAARSLEKLYRAVGAKTGPTITRYRVDQLCNHYTFDTSRAKSVLGFSPTRGWRRAVQEAAEDYKRRPAFSR